MQLWGIMFLSVKMKKIDIAYIYDWMTTQKNSHAYVMWVVGFYFRGKFLFVENHTVSQKRWATDTHHQTRHHHISVHQTNVCTLRSF